ncbi:MAG: amidinotransferase [Deltaproteobacteria bacterium]|nr:MAG: amidinotransferase [Deltaproteobacteria bacterium]
MPAFDRLSAPPLRSELREPDRSVLMADPSFFDVEYVINAHMAGQIGQVDRKRARRQWQALHDVFEAIGLHVSVAEGVLGLPDLVFTANQSFPVRDGTRRVVLSQMALPPRRAEVAHIARHFEERGFECLALPEGSVLEGMGDVLWHPGRRFAYAGWGFRTQRASLDAFADAIGAPVLALKLVDERFYHLDTCLAPLDESCALYVEEAFTPEGRAAIRTCFPDAVAVPVDEAARGFACNGVTTRGHFIVQRGCAFSTSVARSRGLSVVEVETGEFLKSGGSVGCLHMRLQEAW